MTQRKTLLIIKDLPSCGKGYLIDQIATRWSSWGHNVITHYGTDGLPQADLAILHVDMTLVPCEYTSALSCYAKILNQQVMDISKRSYSKNLLEKEDVYAGPVILKTNRNFGGAPESNRFSYLLAKITNRWNWQNTKVMNPNRYPVFADKGHVPAGAWKNDELIVEKFLPEREGELFFVRYWIFLGDRGWAGRIGSKDPIVKFSRMATADEPVPVPEELIRMREALGLDYGRFDFTIHDGRPVVFDINKTIGGAHHIEAYEEPLDQLARGIEVYL